MSCVFRQYFVNFTALIFFSMLFDADGEGTISVATFRVSIERNIFQKIVKVIWGATRTGILTFKRTLTQTFFPGHSQRDWWNLLRWGIGRDLQRCKLFSSSNISVAFFISFVSNPKIIKVFRFHNFRSFSDGSPFNWLQWICENYVLNIVQNIRCTKCKVYHFMKLTRSRTTTILGGFFRNRS